MSRKLTSLLTLIILASLAVAGCSPKPQTQSGGGIPNLPRPIAQDRVLVTTAGQGVEGLIIARYLNQLSIRSYYRHRAEPVDLEDVKSLIIAIGYSPNGLDAAYMDTTKEKTRLRELMKAAQKAKMPVILTHIGGAERRSPLNDEITKELAANANYLVVVRDSNRDMFFTNLAMEKGIPITEVSTLAGVKVPLNSAFR